MRWLAAIGLSLSVGAAACAPPPAADESQADEADLTAIDATVRLKANESILTLVGTNDMHGSFAKMPLFAGYVNAIRAHHASTYPRASSVLVLDAGDAVQGTLTSNYSEGLLAVKLMNGIGYAAAIAGNHGFDFGPVDWTRDQCDAGVASCDPLGSLRRYIGAARFPFLGANVTERATGKTLADLPPYVLVPHQGRTVAILGLENHFTDRTTVPENVAHLSFSDGTKAVRDNVEALLASGAADVFVGVAHEGDGKPDALGMRDWLTQLPRRSDGQPLLDAVIAGHTHFVNDAVAADIPYVQSGANGEKFGVVSLVLSKNESGRLAVVRTRTRKQAGIAIDDAAATFFGKTITPDARIAEVLAKETAVIAPIATELLATTTGLGREGGRLADSEIGNFLTDAMRSESGATLAMINGGDVRDDITAGSLTFEKLFQVLPKNLVLVRSSMPAANVVGNLKLAVESCGRRGAMQISGARIVFERSCERAVNGVDPQAKLLAIIADDGRALYRSKPAETFLVPNIDVATTDFVMSGGAGYGQFKTLPMPSGTPLRAEIAAFAKVRRSLDGADFATGRYVNCLETADHSLCK